MSCRIHPAANGAGIPLAHYTLPQRREAAGLSQGELAEADGVTRQMINPIERDRYDPSLELAITLAAHFECHIEEIFQPEEH